MQGDYVREADMRDLEWIVNSGRRFMEESPLFSRIDYDDAIIKEWITTRISLPKGIVLTGREGGTDAPIGFFIGCVEPYFTGKTLVGFEEVVWVNDLYRGEGIGTMLFEVFQAFARGQGAEFLMSGHNSGVGSNPVQLYSPLGYREMGKTFYKEL
jgi:GNAT superfamily N-acetyltransferase